MSIGPPPVLPDLGQYELIGKIAEGGMGAVFIGRHRKGGPVVAIKVLPAETARNQLLMKRFEQEFRAATLIDHPNVVKAIEYCGTPPHPFLVMEYVSGCSLGEKIERDGPLSESESVHIIRQVCEGLHCAHKQGLIHRDVKPDNVLLTPDLTAKLTDLGLVRDIESDENLTRTGRGLGTPHFMAPEQFRNAKYVDVRSDVYALGATLYMMVTGKVPFAKCSPLDCWVKKTKEDYPTPQTIVPGLSDRIDFAIRRAMKQNPGERPTSCREFMEDVLGEAWRLRSSGPSSNKNLPVADADLWYMVYYEAGQARTVKGVTDTIRKNVQSGVLGDLTAVLVSRSKAGPFAPLKSIPEFRDLVLNGRDSKSGGSARRITPIQPVQRPNATPVSRRSPADTPPPGQFRTPNPTPDAEPVSSNRNERTDVLPDVPLTRDSTLHLGTDERPRMATTRARIQPLTTPRRTPWGLIAVVAGALIIGLIVGWAFG
jgi:eukaryotic-like serine/threonine-protein kinase